MTLILKTSKSITIAGLLVLMGVPSLPAQDARDIIQRMEETMLGESSYAEMTMSIERPRFTREISLRAWAKGDDYSLILVTAPARDEGMAFLKRYNEIWNYVPSIDRTIKMPPSMMSEAWMGSDFSNNDLVRESSTVDDYEHRVLRTEEYNGYECYVLELIPKPDTPIVWGKVLMWFSRDHYMQLRVENYDQRDRLANTIEMDRIRNLGDRTLPTRMILTPADRPGQRTILSYGNLDFDIAINEDFFTQQNMRRVR